MSQIRVINGIGTGMLIGVPSGAEAIPGLNIALPLTGVGGYSEIWSDDFTFFHTVISLDINSRAIEEVPVYIDCFGNWIFDYSNLPMPTTFAIQAASIWNLRSRYNLTLYPKVQQYIGIPDRSFAVNFIGQEGLHFISNDSIYSPGVFGIKLKFRTKVNQQISLGIAPGIGAELPGGGTGVPIEGGM